MIDALPTSIRRARLSGWLLIASLSLAAFTPARAAAEMPDAASLFDYGWKGFTVGAELGLAMGYIATGPKFEHDDWRTLVVGTGVGALLGMSAGITIAIVDATNQGTPTGFYIMRDAGYGTLLGAAMGAVVGCLLWVDMNKVEGSKRVLQGAAWGTLFGAGAGIAYGVLEAQSGTSSSGHSDNGLRLGSGLHLMVAPAPTPHGLGLAAQLAGHFG